LRPRSRASSASPVTAANFVAFLDELDARIPTDLAVHLVLDNGSWHIANATRWWFHEHRRFHPHYTPIHPSWLNQIELFFSILARRLLKRGSSPPSRTWWAR
jgi:transposase